MLSFKITGLNALKRNMDARNRRLKNARSAYAKSVAYVDRWIQKNFEKQGKPVGGWTPLAPSTVKAREMGWGGYKKTARPQILIDIGHLKTHWKHKWTHASGEIASKKHFAIYHQEGGEHLPQRRITPEPDEVKDKILEIFRIFTREALR